MPMLISDVREHRASVMDFIVLEIVLFVAWKWILALPFGIRAAIYPTYYVVPFLRKCCKIELSFVGFYVSTQSQTNGISKSYWRAMWRCTAAITHLPQTFHKCQRKARQGKIKRMNDGKKAVSRFCFFFFISFRWFYLWHFQASCVGSRVRWRGANTHTHTKDAFAHTQSERDA